MLWCYSWTNFRCFVEWWQGFAAFGTLKNHRQSHPSFNRGRIHSSQRYVRLWCGRMAIRMPNEMPSSCSARHAATCWHSPIRSEKKFGAVEPTLSKLRFTFPSDYKFHYPELSAMFEAFLQWEGPMTSGVGRIIVEWSISHFFIQSRPAEVSTNSIYLQCICIAVVRWLGCPESCGRFKYLILFAEGLLWSLRSVFGRDDILSYWVG